MKRYETFSSVPFSTEEDSDDNLPPKKKKKYSEFKYLKQKPSADSDDEGVIPSISSTSDTESQLSADTTSHGEDETTEDENFPNFTDKAKKMMLNMGYKKGKGLGKNQQGIIDPITASKQRGRRGLGFIIEGLEPKENTVWDSSKEHISVEEEVRWIPTTHVGLPIVETMMVWAKIGPKLDDIKDQTEFCHPKILSQVLKAKTIFDQLPDRELHRARSRSNPFETIGKLFFQNRAALKMANLDTVFDCMFTNPKKEDGQNLVDRDELLYFADVCAAPGGFSEYVLYKRKETSHGFCDAKGFGFTLRANDFKLDDFFAASPEYFEPHYGGKYGTDGTGDIFVPDNITNFRDFVLKSTNNQGVHFMMADGGFSVEGNENMQEILSKQLYLCQFIVALGIVREGGHFVCKLFDLFTAFSIGLVYIMYKCFGQIAIHKPNSSRPANSERYIVCKNKKSDSETAAAYDYLFNINLQLHELKCSSETEDILELVPMEILENERPFSQYMYDSNNELGSWQIVALQKIQAYCQDESLFEELQSAMRKESLAYWQLPEKSRTAPSFQTDPKQKLKELLPSADLDKLSGGLAVLTPETLKTVVRSSRDFRFVFMSSTRDQVNERGFFLCLGGSKVYLWSAKNFRSIHRVELPLSIPTDTVFYGELLTEFRGEGKAQRKVKVLHMIDAYVLNGFNVFQMHVKERHRYLEKFAKSINKESRNDLTPVKCKALYKLELFSSVITEPLISVRLMKCSNGLRRRVYLESAASDKEPAKYSIPSGILLLKAIQFPWMEAFSKSRQSHYWFNCATSESTFDFKMDYACNSASSYSDGLVWWWDSGVQLSSEGEEASKCVSIDEFSQHICDLG